jgi:hypothetical protein
VYVAAGTAGTSERPSAVLSDEDLQCLLESLSDSDFDTENELDDRALVHAVGNEGSNEDDSANQEFVWEDMENYRGQRKHFTGSVGALKVVWINNLILYTSLDVV